MTDKEKTVRENTFQKQQHTHLPESLTGQEHLKYMLLFEILNMTRSYVHDKLSHALFPQAAHSASSSVFQILYIEIHYSLAL